MHASHSAYTKRWNSWPSRTKCTKLGPLQNYAHSRDLLVLGFNYALALSVSDAGRKLCLETANNPQQLKRVADKIAKSVDFVEY